VSAASQDIPGDDRFDTSGENESVREMVEWFLARYEDAIENCPHDEGEFIFIWGGPYDALDELNDAFSNRFTETDIERATELLSAPGIEWAGKPKDEPDEDSEEYMEPAPVYVTTILVSDSIEASDVLASVLSLTPSQLRELVRERSVSHAKLSGHIFVRVVDVIEALGLGGA